MTRPQKVNRTGGKNDLHGKRFRASFVEMAPVNLQLPADLVSAAKLDQGDVSQEAAKLIALELFREDQISMGRAAELCLTPLEAFMEFASEHGVSLHYGIDQLEEDRRTSERLGL